MGGIVIFIDGFLLLKFDEDFGDDDDFEHMVELKVLMNNGLCW